MTSPGSNPIVAAGMPTTGGGTGPTTGGTAGARTSPAVAGIPARVGDGGESVKDGLAARATFAASRPTTTRSENLRMLHLQRSLVPSRGARLSSRNYFEKTSGRRSRYSAVTLIV